MPFCSVPLRLDSYSACQFSCSFCFAKARGGAGRNLSNSAASVAAISRRFDRVKLGSRASALDEMLYRRVPIQFGGMTDPFSQIEEKQRTTLSLLKILASADYPTLLSTKSILPADELYLGPLRDGNFYVRISITGASSKLSAQLEHNLPSVDMRLRMIEKLSDLGLPVSVRLQPLILGEENAAAELIRSAADAGAKHVSVEYLKWPMEDTLHQNKLLAKALPNMFDLYKKLGSRKIGREYVLPTEAKIESLFELAKTAKNSGIIFGFADNEFLHLNAFQSCCNGADKFLRNANFFKSNILNGVKSGLSKRIIKFSDIPLDDLPSFSITNYLNSKSRTNTKKLPPSQEWTEYLKEKWNGGTTRGGPSSFWGCENTGVRDSEGNLIFRMSDALTECLEKAQI